MLTYCRPIRTSFQQFDRTICMSQRSDKHVTRCMEWWSTGTVWVDSSRILCWISKNMFSTRIKRWCKRSRLEVESNQRRVVFWCSEKVPVARCHRRSQGTDDGAMPPPNWPIGLDGLTGHGPPRWTVWSKEIFFDIFNFVNKRSNEHVPFWDWLWPSWLLDTAEGSSISNFL